MLPNRAVANTDFFVSEGVVFFELPEDEITQLKTYTATFKFRLGDSWESGNIVPFTVFVDGVAPETVNVIVR